MRRPPVPRQALVTFIGQAANDEDSDDAQEDHVVDDVEDEEGGVAYEPPAPVGPVHPLFLDMMDMQLSHRPTGDRFPKSVRDELRPDSPEVGQVHEMWKGKTVKFTCKQHPKCKLMFENHWFLEPLEPMRAGYRWLGASRYATRDEHVAESLRLSGTAKAAYKERRGGAASSAASGAGSDVGMSSAASTDR
eukprot:1611472-Pyramimonas_sp.AAC.1